MPLAAHLTLDPDVPRDPLAAADSADWAVARRAAVLGLPLDADAQGLLLALAELDRVLESLFEPRNEAATATTTSTVSAGSAPGSAAGTKPQAAPGLPAVAADLITDRATTDDLVELPSHAGRAPTDELPVVSVLDDQLDEMPAVPEDLSADEEITELSADDVAAEPEAVAETYARQVSGDRRRMAAAETLVLSGPDIKRKIRHKQSIMPSFVGQILLEDIVSLQAIEDREGALVSLERLLTVAPMSAQVESFLSHNESKLLQYYESLFGPWSRVARIKPGDAMPAGYYKLPKIQAVVALMDGKAPLHDVISRCGLRRIEACAVLSQLSRSGSLDLGK